MLDPRLPPLLPAVLRDVRVDGLELLVLDEAFPELPYGGNKVRKLRGLLHDALAVGATDLLTFGAVGSHHVLATALWGARLGFRTHALWIPQPRTAHVEETAQAAMALCESVTPVHHLAELPLKTAAVVARIVANTGRTPYRIPPGGSSAVGTRGWVELAQGLDVDVDEIVVASGSGGTAAGLCAGRNPVRAVRVGPRALTNRGRLRSLARRGGAENTSELTIDHDYLAGGYGMIDARTQAAHTAGRDAGLAVETTYSAKALACALVRARMGVRVLFVQTASSEAYLLRTPLPVDLLGLLK